MKKQFSVFNFILLISILLFSLLIISQNEYTQPLGNFSPPTPPQINIPTIAANEKIYIFGAGKVAKLDSAGITYIHNDYLGSANLETDSNRNIVATNTYYPFGKSLSNTGTEKYTFTGKELDKTNLQYYGARYYDQDTGRFTQVDPIGPGYEYAGNNPLRFVDPDGRDYGEIERPIVDQWFGEEPNPGNLWKAGKSLLSSIKSGNRNSIIASGLVAYSILSEEINKPLSAPAMGAFGGGVNFISYETNFMRLSRRMTALENRISRSIRDYQYRDEVYPLQIEETFSSTVIRDPDAAKTFNKVRAKYVGSERNSLTVDDLRDINTQLRPGEHPVGLGIRGIDNYHGVSAGKRAYYSNPNEVPGLLADWYELVDIASEVYPSAKVGRIARENLIKIHPFTDANGRTAKIVEDFYVSKPNK